MNIYECICGKEMIRNSIREDILYCPICGYRKKIYRNSNQGGNNEV